MGIRTKWASIALSLIMLTFVSVAETEISWSGEIDNWNVAGNWDQGVVPTTAYDIVNVFSGEAQISSAVPYVNQLRIGDATLTVMPGAELTLLKNAYFARYQGNAVLNITGGNINFASTVSDENRMYLAWEPGRNTVVNQTAGTVSGGRYFINRGSQWNISGGSLTSPYPISVGGTDSVSELNISGTASVYTDTHIYLGNTDHSMGIINQTDGTVVIGPDYRTPGDLMLGNEPNSIGEYNLSGGTLLINDSIRLGNAPNAAGIFRLSGGEVTINHNIRMARDENHGARAYFVVSGGILNFNGTFNVSGADHSRQEFRVVGSGATSINTERMYFNKRNSSLVFELDADGVTPIQSSEWIDLRGGALKINTLPGFYAQVGDTFDIIYAAADLDWDGVQMDSTTRIDNLSPFFKFAAEAIIGGANDILRLEVVEVNLPDLEAINSAGLLSPADLDEDGEVDIDDLAEFISEWLKANEKLVQ